MNKTDWENEKGEKVNFIKIIDLFNIIANNENIPKTIMFKGKKFEYDELERQYITSNFDNSIMQGIDVYLPDGINQFSLNEEVEIIEEDKTIEELELEERENENQYVLKTDKGYLTIRKADILIINKINELVKEINKIKEIENK